NSFILGCFHPPEYINREVFDKWLEILERCPQACLLFIEYNVWMRENIIEMVKKRGIDTRKIIFSEKLPRDKYLMQLALVDMVLDTVSVNHFYLTADALYMGVPVITLYGSNAALRTSAS